MFDLKDRVEIQVYIRLPWTNKERVCSYAIDRFEVNDSLAPLSQNKEIDPSEYFEKMKQMERRKRLIDLIAKMISNSLINACASEDIDHDIKRDND